MVADGGAAHAYDVHQRAQADAFARFKKQKDLLARGISHGGKDLRHTLPVVRQGGNVVSVHAPV